MRFQTIFLIAAFALGSVTAGLAQFPHSQGASGRTGSDEVWVRVVRNSTGGRTETRHNSNTRIQEVITYDHLNRAVLKRTYRLNRYGQPADFLIYDRRGVVIYRGEFVYDGQDRLGEEKLYSMPRGDLVRRLVYDPLNPKRQPRAQMFGAGVSPDVLRQMSDQDVPSNRPARKQRRSTGQEKERVHQPIVRRREVSGPMRLMVELLGFAVIVGAALFYGNHWRTTAGRLGKPGFGGGQVIAGVVSQSRTAGEAQPAAAGRGSAARNAIALAGGVNPVF